MSKIIDNHEQWLSICSHKKFKGKIVTRDAAVLISADLETILWTNYSGANLFTGNGILEFQQSGISPNHPFYRQLAIAVEQLGNEKIYRGFRIVDGGKSRLLQCKISRIKKLGNHKKSILIQCANEALSEQTEADISVATIESLSGIYPAIAITDELGLPIAASSVFLDAELSPESLRAACNIKNDVGEDSNRYGLTTDNGERFEASVFPIAKDPARFIINIYGLDGNEDNIPVEHKDTTTIIAPTASISANEAEIAPPPVQATSHSDVANDDAFDKTEKPGSKKPKAKKKKKSSKNKSFKRLADGSLHEGVEDLGTSTDDEAGSVNEATSDTPHFPEAPEEFVFDSNAQAIQFRWACDDTQTFTYLSNELSQAVGPLAADMVGRKWKDIARVFDFDNSGAIQALLEKQDTWSGKSVMWPVQGTDLQIPIDLAALPSFGSGRVFTGFSGFGIARVGDAVVDPEAMGLALTKAPTKKETANNEADDEPAAIRIHDDPIDEKDNIEETSSKNNVIKLKSNADGSEDNEQQPASGGLSSGENRAFDEIGKKLKSITQPISTTEKSTSPEPDNVLDGASDNRLGTATPETEEEKLTQGPIQKGVDTSILEKLPVPVIVYRDEEILFVNYELLRMCGYQNIDQLREAGGIKQLFDDPDEAPIDDGRETVLRDIDGNHLKVQALLQSVPWDEERAMLLSFRQPRHENLPANEKIVLDMMRVSELQNILDTATDGIIILNHEGMMESLNPSAEALFGKTIEPTNRQHITELFAKESHEKIIERFTAEEKPDEEINMPNGLEVIGVEAKGRLIPLFMTIGNIGADGNKCAVLRDMTHWKKTREELVNAKKEAENASDQKTEFLARISHEIREPLNAIIGFSDVMIDEQFGPVDNDRYREYLRDINRSGVHVLDLINDLLDISKIEAGKMDISFEAVNLNDIVSETVSLLQPQANGRRVLIRTSLSRAVPNVVADARSIRQIVLNLVSNAIKFTSANGQVIVSTVYEGNGEVAMRVRDTGKGMSESEIKSALKPFQQINSLSDNQVKGTGLGLPLTKALVEANKAFFEIESERGKGTIVHVQFPTQRVLAD